MGNYIHIRLCGVIILPCRNINWLFNQTVLEVMIDTNNYIPENSFKINYARWRNTESYRYIHQMYPSYTQTKPIKLVRIFLRMYGIYCTVKSDALPIIYSTIDGASPAMITAWLVTNDKSTLVQVMAWCRQATSHYLNQCWPRSPMPCGVTRPQWVNWQQPGGDNIIKSGNGLTAAGVFCFVQNTKACFQKCFWKGYLRIGGQFCSGLMC